MFKLISVNIEHDKHIDKILPFLDREKPDVLYVQELFEKDYPAIKECVAMDGIFKPYLIVKSSLDGGKLHMSGCAILARFPMKGIGVNYYYGNPEKIPTHGEIPVDEQPKVLISALVNVEEKDYNLATTHFTWSADGNATLRQWEDAQNLIKLLDNKKRLILAGDFNAPRGHAIFSLFNKIYRDNIPKEYTTSIDKNIHRAGDLQLMVDCLFSTEDIEFEKVKLVDGVSDHMAIVAEVK